MVLLASSGDSDLFAIFIPSADAERNSRRGSTPELPEPIDLSPPWGCARDRARGSATRMRPWRRPTGGSSARPPRSRQRDPPKNGAVDASARPPPPSCSAARRSPSGTLGGVSSVARRADAGQPSSVSIAASTPSTRCHRRARHAGSTRTKGFVTGDARGNLWIRHNTSEQTRLRLPGQGAPLVDAGLAPANDGAFSLSENGILRSFAVRDPHPEVTLKTLFGKVWYEGYEKPEFVWQSTGGTDDFEPKLSLTPLVYGTLKATFYASVFAIPIASPGALCGGFRPPSVRRVVKPVVEIWPRSPSVVIGFLAGLWLALSSRGRSAPAHAARRAALVSALRSAARGPEPAPWISARVETSCCSPWWSPVSARPGAGSVRRGLGVRRQLQDWLFENFQERYDPRNSLIIGFAMGFAVIPLIFTISEDAFSNVPAHLSAASLALGASRWQTAARVIVPTASPGVFSAVMIGFGRAVGETMIVLMATGNTPIMDWSIFNGMRTLSANIAVEIPEAPFGGTLYRILFFASAILFVMTFCVNTAAEIVRQRLRRKYEVL